MASPETVSRNLRSTRVSVHSSLNHTNQVSVGALRTPLPWALGMQYLRTSIVLLLARPAIAMHVSLFCAAEGLVLDEDEEEAESTVPPQIGLGFFGKRGQFL